MTHPTWPTDAWLEDCYRGWPTWALTRAAAAYRAELAEACRDGREEDVLRRLALLRRELARRRTAQATLF